PWFSLSPRCKEPFGYSRVGGSSIWEHAAGDHARAGNAKALARALTTDAAAFLWRDEHQGTAAVAGGHSVPALRRPDCLCHRLAGAVGGRFDPARPFLCSPDDLRRRRCRVAPLYHAGGG